MTLSTEQLKNLRAQGITVLIERNDGVCKCAVNGEVRRYLAEDLVQIAKPGFCDRLTAWIGRRVSA